MSFNYAKMCIKYIESIQCKQSLVRDILGMFISCGGVALSLILLVGEALYEDSYKASLESVVSN